jgi:hypothetical protein
MNTDSSETQISAGAVSRPVSPGLISVSLQVTRPVILSPSLHLENGDNDSPCSQG